MKVADADSAYAIFFRISDLLFPHRYFLRVHDQVKTAAFEIKRMRKRLTPPSRAVVAVSVEAGKSLFHKYQYFMLS